MGACQQIMLSEGGSNPITTAPVVQSRNAALGSFTNSQSITLPSGITVGDLILVFFSCQGTATPSINTGVSGANWVVISGPVFTGTSVAQYVVAKIAEGSDALTISLTGTVWTAYAGFRISGCDSTSKVYVNNAAITTSTSVDPPSISPSYGTNDYLIIANAGWVGSQTVSSFPSGYTGTQSLSSGASNKASQATAETTVSSVSSENPGTFTLSATVSCYAYTVALRG